MESMSVVREDAPLLVTFESNRTIRVYVEKWRPLSELAESFLVEVGDCVMRVDLFQEYHITPSSIATAARFGIEPEKIFNTLCILSKHDLSEKVGEFIQLHAKGHGQAWICVEYDGVFLYVCSSEARMDLFSDSSIREARIPPFNMYDNRFKIKPEMVQMVRKHAHNLGYHVEERFDYINDERLPLLRGHLVLPEKVSIRPYQAEALAKMCHDGIARSGVIVLPCGAGKTLTAISAGCTINKSMLVVCNNVMSCNQWVREFERCTNIPPQDIMPFTSTSTPSFEYLNQNEYGVIVVTTYSTLCVKSEIRRKEALPAISLIKSKTWGLVIVDEVHMAPADHFKEAIKEIRACCKLGLTATMVREDDRIGDIRAFIGPKLYDIEWKKLADAGYIATVECFQVVCPFASEFLKMFRPGNDVCQFEGKYLLFEADPNKLEAAFRIMRKHEKLGHRILVFADRIEALKTYAKRVKRYLITGETSKEEAEELLKRFRLDDSDPRVIKTLILSRVGEVGLDLPQANVLIQIGSQGKSRRQESQRMGRILRAKEAGAKAFFYSLVTRDTPEERDAQSRRDHLIREGYVYKDLDWKDHFKFPYQFYSEETQRLFLLELAPRLASGASVRGHVSKKMRCLEKEEPVEYEYF